jgi:hypothetical protein
MSPPPNLPTLTNPQEKLDYSFYIPPNPSPKDKTKKKDPNSDQGRRNKRKYGGRAPRKAQLIGSSTTLMDRNGGEIGRWRGGLGGRWS